MQNYKKLKCMGKESQVMFEMLSVNIKISLR